MKRITTNALETHSTDVVALNLEHLKMLFPDAFTEGKVDFKVLKQLLGSAVDERKEKYGLNWYASTKLGTQGNIILLAEQLPEVPMVPSRPFAPGGQTALGLPVPAQQQLCCLSSRDRR